MENCRVHVSSISAWVRVGGRRRRRRVCDEGGKKEKRKKEERKRGKKARHGKSDKEEPMDGDRVKEREETRKRAWKKEWKEREREEERRRTGDEGENLRGGATRRKCCPARKNGYSFSNVPDAHAHFPAERMVRGWWRRRGREMGKRRGRTKRVAAEV